MREGTRVICEAMDCKHIEPIETLTGKEPFVGYCRLGIVQMFGREYPKCITYEEDDGEREQLCQKGE